MAKSQLLLFNRLKQLLKRLPKRVQLVITTLMVIVVISYLLWPQQLASMGQLINSTLNPSSLDSPEPKPSDRQPATKMTVEGQPYQVSQVVDGDTIKIVVDTEEVTVRLIGIDTPEVVDPRKAVECFGREASAKTKSLVEGKKVTVTADRSQGNVDKYGRLLRYIYLPDGQMVNLLLIQQGYAFEYTYSTPCLYQPAFKAAQIVARTDERGLWSLSKCGGQRQLGGK